MLPNLSVRNLSVPSEGIPAEIWANVFWLSVIDDEVRDWEAANPNLDDYAAIASAAKSLDRRFMRRFSCLCKINVEFRTLCASDPSIWPVIVERERDVMIARVTKLQEQQANTSRPRYTFRPIDDFLQVFLEKTEYTLTYISPNLGRGEAMRTLVLMFGAPKWFRESMWVFDGEEKGEEEDDDEFDEFDDDEVELPYVDDEELGPEGGGYPPED